MPSGAAATHDTMPIAQSGVEASELWTLRENLGLPFPTNRHALARSASHAAE